MAARVVASLMAIVLCTVLLASPAKIIPSAMEASRTSSSWPKETTTKYNRQIAKEVQLQGKDMIMEKAARKRATRGRSARQVPTGPDPIHHKRSTPIRHSP